MRRDRKNKCSHDHDKKMCKTCCPPVYEAITKSRVGLAHVSVDKHGKEHYPHVMLSEEVRTYERVRKTKKYLKKALAYVIIYLFVVGLSFVTPGDSTLFERTVVFPSAIVTLLVFGYVLLWALITAFSSEGI